MVNRVTSNPLERPSLNWLRATVLVSWTSTSQQALTERPAGTAHNTKQDVRGLRLHGAHASAKFALSVPTMWVSEWVRKGKSLSHVRLFATPMDYSVYGIFQARVLEWAALPFSRGSSQPRDRTQVSHIAGGFLTSWATREVHHVKVLLCLRTLKCDVWTPKRHGPQSLSNRLFKISSECIGLSISCKIIPHST